MVDALELIWHALRDGLLMAWQVWWALVLGFAISAVVQAWVPRGRIERGMAGEGVRPVGIATALGAASSSCSYAAIAIARSLFAKGASAASSLAFQFASTNLVWELGLVLWVLLGWQFTLGEYLGGIVMIALMALLLRAFVSPGLEAQAREHARRAQEAGHDHHHHHGSGGPDPQLDWRGRVRSLEAWREVSQNFLGDWQMLYKEIGVGFLIAGFVAQLGNGFFSALFVEHAPAPLGPIENVIVGPLIAVLSFVCSVGNVPLAAVLWSGGISFAGVLAFLYADLIVLPIIAAYRKFYGWRYTVRIVALMYRHDGVCGAGRGCPVRRPRADPVGPAPGTGGHLRGHHGRLQARAERGRAAGLRRAGLDQPERASACRRIVRRPTSERPPGPGEA